MNQPLVLAQSLTKTYRLYPSPWDRLLEMVAGGTRHRAVHALRDVSFQLDAGESLGIVGENGAGKSTLLKILSGVTAPTSGKIEVRGRVASLLELGMGFHPELTGRQNIRLTAAIMGFSPEEVDTKIPEILDFSELGHFIDRPIKTYSSGMAMRLGFAIAAQVDPEVLIIDEALSVGDGYFQKKCMDKIRALLDQGCTFLFCSHAMYYVSTFCERALWLRDGEPVALGPVADVVREYESFLLARRRGESVRDGEEAEGGEAVPTAHSPAKILDVRPTGGETDGTYRCGSPWGLEIRWWSERPELAFHVGVGVNRADGVQLFSFLSIRSDLPAMSGREHYRLHLRVPSLPVMRGELDLYVFLADEAGLHVYDQAHLPNALVVDSDDYDYGILAVDHEWELLPADRSVGEPARIEVPGAGGVRGKPESAPVPAAVDRGERFEPAGHRS